MSDRPSAVRRPRPTGSQRGQEPRRRAEPGARSDKGAATRDQIVVAAAPAFSRMGYGGTRLEDIARAAGISRTTVYYYFPSRRDVFIEIGRAATRAFRGVVDVARSTPDRWSDADVAALVTAHLAYLDAHGTVVTTWTQATWDDHELRDVGLEAQIRQFRAIGDELCRLRGGDQDVEPVHEGMAFLGMIERLWYFARNGGVGADDAELVRTLTLEAVAILRRNRSTPRP